MKIWAMTAIRMQVPNIKDYRHASEIVHRYRVIVDTCRRDHNSPNNIPHKLFNMAVVVSFNIHCVYHT